MKKTNLALLLLAVIVVLSCNKMLMKKYKIGRPFDMKSQSAFANHLRHIKIAPLEHFVYPDSAGFMKLLPNLIEEGGDLKILYGYYLNDSISIKYSNTLNEKKYCAGRMENEMKQLCKTQTFDDTSKIKNPNIMSFGLRRVKDHSKLESASVRNKRTIFLIYAYSMGTSYDQLYKEAYTIQKLNKGSTDLYIICIDPIYRLKP